MESPSILADSTTAPAGPRPFFSMLFHMRGPLSDACLSWSKLKAYPSGVPAAIGMLSPGGQPTQTPEEPFEFLFLSQRVRRAAFGDSIAPRTPVLKLKHPFAC